MLPDLSGFSKLGSEYKNEQECSKWQKKEEIGAKVYRLKKPSYMFIGMFIIV